jgi:hypothetical protein
LRDVNGYQDPRIDGVKPYGDEISTALRSVLFAEKEKRGGMRELRLLGIPSLRRPPRPPGVKIYQRAERGGALNIARTDKCRVR